MGLPGGSDGTESARLGRSTVEGDGNPLQYYYRETSMDSGAWGGYSQWGCKELDMSEQLALSLHSHFSLIIQHSVEYLIKV